MALPTTKQELADWILRRLGAPVINIEISDEQLEDVIDESLQFYREYHFDGSERVYRTIQITEKLLAGNSRRPLAIGDADDYVFGTTYAQSEKIIIKGKVYIAKLGTTPVVFNANNTDGYTTTDRILFNNMLFQPKNDITGAIPSTTLTSTATFSISADALPNQAGTPIAVNNRLGDTITPNVAGFEVTRVNDTTVSLNNNAPNVDITELLASTGVINGTNTEFTISNPNNYTAVIVSDITNSPVRLSNTNITISGTTVSILTSEVPSGSTLRFGAFTEQVVIFTVTGIATAISNPVAGSKYKNVTTPVLDTDAWDEESKLLNNQNIIVTNSGQIGIRIPENIIAVTKIFKFDAFTASGIYSYDYQFFLNNFDFFYSGHGAGGGALTSYYIQRTYIEFIEHMINPQPAIRFNKHKNRLFIDTDWNRVARGRSDQNFLAECYEVADPEVYGDVYSDSWLKKYATALAKRQWGSNLKKYEGTQLPGGITVNGQVMYDEGNNDANALEEELKLSLQLEMDGILIG